jgi:hypothetical protein
MSVGVHQFYPTPPEIAFELFSMVDDWLRVLEPLHNQWNGSIVKPNYQTFLDPSGGKGDMKKNLLHHFQNLVRKESGRLDERDITFRWDFIEIDPVLAASLQEHGSVIGNDFLQYNEALLYDCVIMNPPFAKGVEHVLHAYDLMRSGTLLAIINASNLENPHTRKRKMLLDLIEENGEWKTVEGAFTSAERKTNVKVALICMTKQSSYNAEDFDFAFEKEDTDVDFDEINSSTDLAFRENKLVLYERMYNESKRLFVDALKSYVKLAKCLRAFGAGDEPLKAVQQVNITSAADYNSAYMTFLKSVRHHAWHHIMRQGNFRSRLDSRTAKDFEAFVQQQTSMAYSAKNIMAVFEMIVMNQGLYQQKAILTAFDFLTRYTEENREHFEGWKTNEAWRVPKKVILPGGVRYGEYMSAHDLSQYGDTFSTPYNYQTEWTDLEKAMMICEGLKPNLSMIDTLDDALNRHFKTLGTVKRGPFDNKTKSTYFNIRFYKKGTVHLTWRDDELREKFNRIACEGKGWLPPSDPKKNKHDGDGPSTEIELFSESESVF